ncbi:MAG: DUF1315 family protein [Endozoicomonas sp. (ex Botrylloides leachii)]|nr:DUF1315 family protein [Endozoicomonas sp. (ex Botrylloides leachii)]
MNIKQVLSQLTPNLYYALRQSLELSKWPDGRDLMPEQKEIVLEALIIYEHDHIPVTKRMGYIPQQCGSKSSKQHASTPDTIYPV